MGPEKKKTMQQVQIITWNLKEEYTYSVAVPLLIYLFIYLFFGDGIGWPPTVTIMIYLQ